MRGWWFRGNTSSDEIVGHMSAYPLVHDLVAKSSAQRARVVSSMRNITAYIVQNGFVLKNAQRETTQWGHWDPAALNGDPARATDRGGNSLQILAFLSNTHRLTHDPAVADAFRFLVDRHGYADNVVNAKVTEPANVNTDDDELLYQRALGFLWSGLPVPPLGTLPPGRFVTAAASPNPLYAELLPFVARGTLRAWRSVARYRPAPWAYVTAHFADVSFANGSSAAMCTFIGDACRVARWCLRSYPVSSVGWPTVNVHRLDVELDRRHPSSDGAPRLQQ